jgi:hypothetical protein
LGGIAPGDNPIVGWGIACIVAGALLSALVVVALWRDVRPPVAFGLAVMCGLLVGVGALLVQDDVSWAEWAVTLVALGALAPLHARLVFGRPGTRT